MTNRFLQVFLGQYIAQQRVVIVTGLAWAGNGEPGAEWLLNAWRGNLHLFTFMHLADAFIQSDIQFIHVLSVCVFPGNRTHDLCAANAVFYHWATGACCGSTSLSYCDCDQCCACVSVSREDVEDAGPVAHFPQFSYSASIRESDWLRPIMHHDGLWSWSHVVCFSVQMDLSLSLTQWMYWFPVLRM